MNKNEKLIVVFFYFFIALYLPVFFYYIEIMPNWLIPLHIFGMTLSLAFVGTIVKDIIKRDYLSTREKAVWICIVVFMWPTSIIYIIKHGFKPRTYVETGSDLNCE